MLKKAFSLDKVWKVISAKLTPTSESESFDDLRAAIEYVKHSYNGMIFISITMPENNSVKEMKFNSANFNEFPVKQTEDIIRLSAIRFDKMG